MKLPPLLALLRPHQWSKNLLVFVSVCAGHQLGDARLLSLSAVAFAVFCLAASGGYVLNDIADLRDDRAHPGKRARPLAAGVVSVRLAGCVAIGLLAAALAIAFAVSVEFLAVVLAYLVASQVYTYWAKRKLALDIVILAGLYTSRILAGVLVTGVQPSFWLLAFSMFLFFSLAALKRFVEVVSRDGEDMDRYSARAYRRGDAFAVAALGAGSGVVSVLVLALYLNSREVVLLYSMPGILWLACPLFLYWIARTWLLAGRGLVHEDPIVFALRDPASYVLLVLLAAIVVIAA